MKESTVEFYESIFLSTKSTESFESAIESEPANENVFLLQFSGVVSGGIDLLDAIDIAR